MPACTAADGLFLGAAFGGETLNELRTVLAEAEIAENGGLSPRVAPMAEVRQMGALLQRAGLALPGCGCACAHRQLRGRFCPYARPSRNGGNQRADRPAPSTGTAKPVRARAAIYADRFPDEAGRIRATFEVIFLTGWAPHESQQKPLRPGSAKARFAEALNATHVEDNAAMTLDRADD
jgi:hypothetical protein